MDDCSAGNNGGDGFHFKGNIDSIKIVNSTSKNNGKNGIYLDVPNDSDVTLAKIEVFGNGLNGINVSGFDSVIDLAMGQAKNSNEFSEEELKYLNNLLGDLKEHSKQPNKIHQVLKEIYGIGKSCIPGILSGLMKYFLENPIQK